MKQNQTFQEVVKIFQEVFDDPMLVVTPKTVADDVEDWDSLNHIQLVVAIEKHFKIKFTSSEIQSFLNVGDVCKKIDKKINA